MEHVFPASKKPSTMTTSSCTEAKVKRTVWMVFEVRSFRVNDITVTSVSVVDVFSTQGKAEKSKRAKELARNPRDTMSWYIEERIVK